MRFSEAKGRQVVTTSTAETVGKVDELLVDPRERKVVALTLKKTKDGDTLRWSDLEGFGSDAVTIEDPARITETPDELERPASKDGRLLGKRVLSTTGDELGRLDDVDFDPETGSVTGLVLADEELPGDRLVGVGSYAVVVRAG